jgi:hypothetical protein
MTQYWGRKRPTLWRYGGRYLTTHCGSLRGALDRSGSRSERMASVGELGGLPALRLAARSPIAATAA